VDSLLPQVLELGPEVIVVTADHSTPSKLKSHSWHPIPVLLFSPNCRVDEVERFDEISCIKGGLGRLPAVALITLALAHARRLKKYGA
jgi:2,3-bisphosphoglycerate-independent phosphoglycerate mutase